MSNEKKDSTSGQPLAEDDVKPIEQNREADDSSIEQDEREATSVEQSQSLADESSIAVETVEPDENLSHNSVVNETEDENKLVEAIEKLSCVVNEFPLDRRFAEFPLRTEVILGLQEKGFPTATRYQQALLHHILLGKDYWVNARLSSNRGIALGAYFTEIAASNIDSTTVLVCSAIPEVRRNLSNDIMECSIFTDIQVGMIQEDLSAVEEIQFAEKPNIMIASPRNLLQLVTKQKIALSSISVIYVDEVERITAEQDIQSITELLAACPENPQLIIQSATLSQALVQQVGLWREELKPMLLVKEESSPGDKRYCVGFSTKILHSYLLERPMSRTVVVCPAEDKVEEIGFDLVNIGWDTDILCADSHPKQIERSERKLKLGYLQVLVCTSNVLRKLKIPYVSQVIFTEGISSEEHQSLLELFPKAHSLTFVEPEESLDETLKFEPLTDGESELKACQQTVQVLRKNSARLGFQSYEKLVDSILEEPDGKALLALALRQAIQLDRVTRINSFEEQLRLENKDIFQRRRNQRRGKYNRRKYNKRR